MVKTQKEIEAPLTWFKKKKAHTKYAKWILNSVEERLKTFTLRSGKQKFLLSQLLFNIVLEVLPGSKK